MYIMFPEKYFRVLLCRTTLTENVQNMEICAKLHRFHILYNFRGYTPLSRSDITEKLWVERMNFTYRTKQWSDNDLTSALLLSVESVDNPDATLRENPSSGRATVYGTNVPTQLHRPV